MKISQGLHLLSAFLTVFLGFVVWLAPHIDWSNAKDDNLYSERGFLVLGITVFCFGINMWAALMPSPAKRQSRGHKA